MDVNDKLIVSHFSNVYKIEILEVTNETILYKNIDNYSRNSRVTKHEFYRDFKIVEVIEDSTNSTPNIKKLLKD